MEKYSDATILKSEGTAERAILYRVQDVFTADTINVAPDFSKVKAACAILAGCNTTIQADPTVDDTTLTFAQSGWESETVYLLVVGNYASATSIATGS